MSLLDFSLFLIGLVFGSFVSALTWRYPIKISFIRGRSICPNCKKQIRWFDNIPLVSFISLKGKCRNCNKHISFRYPMIELASGIGFLTLQGVTFQGVYSISHIIEFVAVAAVFLILLSIFVIDFEHQIIPDDFVFWGIIIFIFYLIFISPSSILPRLGAGLFAASSLLIIHLLTRGRGMGLGDVKFAILGGIITGLRLFSIWLFLAFLTGAVVGIILILGKKARMKSKIAFGPFLILAIPLALVYGEKIFKWLYFN